MIKIVVIFVATLLAISVLLSLIAVLVPDFRPNGSSSGSFVSNMNNTFLYILGYGANETDSDTVVVMKNLLALIGIIAVCIMTTKLTLYLFWRVDDVVVAPKLFISSREMDPEQAAYDAAFLVCNHGKQIADVRLSYAAYYEGDNESVSIAQSTDYRKVFLNKEESWLLSFPVNDSAMINILYKMFGQDSRETVKIFLSLWFIDTVTGQQCCNIVSIGKDDILLVKDVKEYKSHSFRQFKKMRQDDQTAWDAFVGTCKEAYKPFDSGRLKPSPQKTDDSPIVEIIREDKRGPVIRFKTGKPHEMYPMGFYDFNAHPMNWNNYSDASASFVCELELLEGGDIPEMLVEVKTAGKTIFRVRPSFQHGRIMIDQPLSGIFADSNEAQFADIREICIVVDRNTPKNLSAHGDVRVNRCGVEYKE